ncbi:MAG: hypothetical protein K0S44_1928 [Bacteroidetes bacterium]|jgi:hypothetical protein|nr:hypothetical protein [Bacteroidota bacterium]
MKTKPTLNSKLKSYSAIAGTMIATANSAEAQVVYTDVTPDASITSGGTYDLDLNNDGTVDYEFSLNTGTFTYGGLPIQYNTAQLTPSSGNAIDTVAGGGPNAHDINESINSGLIWADDAGAPYQMLGFALPAFSYQGGNFSNQTNKYAGLRFKIAGVDHYGWVRIDLDDVSTMLTIKDFAYDATPGASILTGALTTAINENSLEKNVLIYASENIINVNMNNTKGEGMITVLNTLGQVISKTSITGSRMNISMLNESSGIYFVNIIQGSSELTKKVIIK